MKAAAVPDMDRRTLGPRGRGGLWTMLLSLAPAAVCLFVLLTDVSAVAQIRNLLFDHYQRMAPRPWSPDLPVRIVDIDDASLARYGQWPWPRETLARLTRKLAEADPAAIVFDVIFAEEDRYAPERLIARLPQTPERDALAKRLAADETSDGSFADALRDTRSVLALALTSQPSPQTKLAPKAGFVQIGDRAAPALPHFPYWVVPIEALRDAAHGLGAINYLPDRDLIVRKAPMLFALTDGKDPLLVPSIDAEALRVAQGTDTILVKSTRASGEASFLGTTSILETKIGDALIQTERDGAVRIRFAGHQPQRFVPAWRVLEGDIAADDLRNRIVFIGASAAALSDIRSTPIDTAIPGVEIHAEMIEHAATGSRLVRLDYAEGVEALALVVCALLAAFAVARMRPFGATLATAFIVASLAVASWLAFLKADLLFDPILPGTAAVSAFGMMTLLVFRRTERDRRQVRDAFSRYLAPAVVERLAADPSRLRLGGETRDMTMMFCDVRDFTARAERLDAQSVIAFLNALHTPLTEAVLSTGGTIDKFVGDGLMAFWNAPLDTPDHATRACEAALAMLEAIPSIERELQAAATSLDPAPHVRIGVGINTGEAVVGNMGSQQRFDFSVVGDNVNIAARLEAATKILQVPILVTEATAKAATGFDFVDLGQMSLRGKADGVRVFALHGRTRLRDASFPDFEALHQRALTGDPLALQQARLHPEGQPYASFYDTLPAPAPTSQT